MPKKSSLPGKARHGNESEKGNEEKNFMEAESSRRDPQTMRRKTSCSPNFVDRFGRRRMGTNYRLLAASDLIIAVHNTSDGWFAS